MNKYIKITITIAVSLLVGYLSSIVTQSSIKTWYPTLVKSFFNPPNWIFAPVWTLLYILMGISAVISLQKAVRDKAENIKVNDMYYGISWVIVITSLLLLIIGLRNADLELSEKGFYGISYLLSLFGAITVQKNTRDIEFINSLYQNEK